MSRLIGSDRPAIGLPSRKRSAFLDRLETLTVRLIKWALGGALSGSQECVKRLSIVNNHNRLFGSLLKAFKHQKKIGLEKEIKFLIQFE